MARKRDYRAEYARRQARARELGFSSYYERRTRLRPGAPKPPAETLARRGGKRGRAGLLAAAKDGASVYVRDYDRNPDGTYKRLVFVVVDLDGSEREFTISGKGMDRDAAIDLANRLDAQGAIQPFANQSPALRALFAKDAQDDDDDVDLEAGELDEAA